MTNRIGAGTILLEDGIHKPRALVIATEACLAKWSYVNTPSSSTLGRQIEANGWTFFYMAGEITRRVFGFDDWSRTGRAVAKIIIAVKDEGCNCLEIAKVDRGTFLGFPYTSITAHARHIQKGRSFCDLASNGLPLRGSLRSPDWKNQQSPLPRSQAPAAVHSFESWENEGGSTSEMDLPHVRVAAQ